MVCGSIQSIALNLDMFKDDEFDYLIIDEAHHATADTYQRVLSYFKPRFTLGLTATPERTDDINILEIFKNTAHKPGIQTAVVFCASVKHAQLIAGLFKTAGTPAAAVSGSMKPSERNEQLVKFSTGETKVLCACDLLNEGWDCPETEVLFMARPTMSKMLYTQQLGRGMRTSPGKEYLMIFDFVDNASQYNMPYSMHRLFRLKDYHAGGTVLGKKSEREAEEALYSKGEKPNSIFAKGGYTDKQAENNILSNPFKRFEDMNMMRHTKTLGIVEIDSTVWKKLSDEEKEMIERICDKKLEEYFKRIGGSAKKFL